MMNSLKAKPSRSLFESLVSYIYYKVNIIISKSYTVLDNEQKINQYNQICSCKFVTNYLGYKYPTKIKYQILEYGI